MIKKINIKSKLMALLLTSSISLTTVGCSSNKSHNDITYNSDDYMVLYVDGVAHLIQTKTSIYKILFQNKVEFYDAKTNVFLAYWDADNEKQENPIFSSSLQQNTSFLAIHYFSELVNNDTFDQETFDFFTDKDKANEYIAENYLYDVKSSCSYDNDMRLFKFNDGDEELSYHIGYNACLKSESNYIYDIVDNTIYKKPDIGMCESININELYSKDQITANEAEELIETYINYKGDKEKVLAKSK